jgi:DNA-binding transcriptional MocR family regulator
MASAAPSYDLTGRQGRPSAECRRRWVAACALAADDDDAWRRPPRTGDPRLVGALSSMVGAPEGVILPVAGIRAAGAILARSTRRLLIERPTFPGIPSLFRESGCEVRLAPWDELEKEQQRWRPDLVWVTAPCRNPDGRSLPRELLDSLVAGQGDGRVVANEAYRWYGSPHAVTEAIVVGSFHKLVGGGGRLGWLVDRRGPREVPEPYRASLPPGILQRTWANFLVDGGMEQCVEDVVRPVSDANRAFRASFGLPLAGDPGAPFVVLRAGPSRSEAELADEFRRRRMVVGLGSAFHVAEPSVRLCFTSVAPEEAAAVGSRVRGMVEDGIAAA